jgi:hypothetical protein
MQKKKMSTFLQSAFLPDSPKLDCNQEERGLYQAQTTAESAAECLLELGAEAEPEAEEGQGQEPLPMSLQFPREIPVIDYTQDILAEYLAKEAAKKEKETQEKKQSHLKAQTKLRKNMQSAISYLKAHLPASRTSKSSASFVIIAAVNHIQTLNLKIALLRERLSRYELLDDDK